MPSSNGTTRRHTVRLHVELPDDLPIGSLRELLEYHGIHTLEVTQVDERPAPVIRRVDIVAPLTPTERIVLISLTCSDTTKTVAQKLSVSETTIKTHVRAILRKLRVGSRTAAVGRALRLGLISIADIEQDTLGK
jgi:DNA-binding NarL/FixJ family response regulator